MSRLKNLNFVFIVTVLQSTSYGLSTEPSTINLRNSALAPRFNACNIPRTFANGRIVQGGGAYGVEVHCDEGYGPFPPTSNLDCDVKTGKWSTDIPECLRTCSPRFPALADVSCKKNGLNLDCYSPLVDGAKQYVRCKPRYSEDNPFNKPSVECNAACGQVAPRGKPLIVNGVSVRTGEFPWHVAIYKINNVNSKYEYQCGGSIINPQIVLTAAHCFADHNATMYNMEEFTLAAGKYFRYYNTLLDIFAQERSIEEILIPSDYKGFLSSYSADIALVILQKPFELTNAVQSVCLDWNNIYERQQLKSNAFGKVPGWGFTTEGRTLSVELKKLIVPYINRDMCINNVPENFVRFVTPDKFCTGYRNGSSVCNGDSGGGLVFYRNEDQRYYIRGLVSIGPISQATCDSNQYGAYTKISHYMDYIRSVVETYSGKCKYQYNQSDNSTTVSICLNGTWNRPPVECVPECGEAVPRDTFINVDGTPINKLNFPWVVGIYQEDRMYMAYSLVCVGSIISVNTVLTSGRCMFLDGTDGKDKYVAAGKYYRDYDSVLDILAQKKKVLKVEYPPHFHERKLDLSNDIAIVVVEQPFVLNNFIRPVCLDFQNKFGHHFNKEATITGWDFVYEENYEIYFKGEFKQVTIPYKTHEECDFTGYSNSVDTFCSLFVDDKITCNSEFGGGLVAYNNKENKYYLIGVISYPNYNRRGCHNYTVYTNITHYSDFIKKIGVKYKV